MGGSSIWSAETVQVLLSRRSAMFLCNAALSAVVFRLVWSPPSRSRSQPQPQSQSTPSTSGSTSSASPSRSSSMASSRVQDAPASQGRDGRDSTAMHHPASPSTSTAAASGPHTSTSTANSPAAHEASVRGPFLRGHTIARRCFRFFGYRRCMPRHFSMSASSTFATGRGVTAHGNFRYYRYPMFAWVGDLLKVGTMTCLTLAVVQVHGAVGVDLFLSIAMGCLYGSARFIFWDLPASHRSSLSAVPLPQRSPPATSDVFMALGIFGSYLGYVLRTGRFGIEDPYQDEPKKTWAIDTYKYRAKTQNTDSSQCKDGQQASRKASSQDHNTKKKNRKDSKDIDKMVNGHASPSVVNNGASISVTNLSRSKQAHKKVLATMRSLFRFHPVDTTKQQMTDGGKSTTSSGGDQETSNPALQSVAVAPMSCPICLGAVRDGDMVSAGRVCGHAFHHHCLSEWLAKSTSCPYCRCDLELKICKPVEMSGAQPSLPRSLWSRVWPFGSQRREMGLVLDPLNVADDESHDDDTEVSGGSIFEVVMNSTFL